VNVEQLREPDKQAMRDELAMRVLVAWCGIGSQAALGPLENPDIGSLGNMKARAQQYAVTAIAIADGFMAARAERVKTPP
jgi:hypothetical protein